MIKNFLSHYRPKYVRSLIYMLQSSEYKLGEYLAWFHRVKDFGQVEKRKQLEITSKAVVLLVLAWGLLTAIFSFALYLLILSTTAGYILGVVILMLSPYLLAYGIVIPLLAVQFIIQKPIEYVVIRRARSVLMNHRGIKIAVAGSFGKTSMREILKTVLAEGKKVAAPPHSYNTPLGISEFTKTLTGDEEVLIFEMGEYYPGDVRRLCDLVRPDMGFITGINEAHLQKFKTLDRTVATIFELADYLGDRPTYVNGENELAKKNARPGHILYSRNGTKDLKVENCQTGLEGTSFSVLRKASEQEFSSSLLGLHQVGPLVGAIDIAFNIGLTESDIRDGIRKTKPFDHRLEPKTDNTGVITLDDSYNGNPDGVKAVIDFLSVLKDHRRFFVTPGLVEMGNQSEAIHLMIGTWLAEAEIENVVLMRNSVTEHIEKGLQSAKYHGVVLWFDHALEAFSALPLITVKGDVVLLQNDWPDQYA